MCDDPPSAFEVSLITVDEFQSASHSRKIKWEKRRPSFSALKTDEIPQHPNGSQNLNAYAQP